MNHLVTIILAAISLTFATIGVMQTRERLNESADLLNQTVRVR